MFNLKQDGFHVVLKKPCRAFFGLFDSTSVDRIYHFSLVARGFFSLEEGSHEMLLALAQARWNMARGAESTHTPPPSSGRNLETKVSHSKGLGLLLTPPNFQAFLQF